MRSWLPGSPMNRTEDRSGSTRSFSLAKAEETANSVTRATRPPAMRTEGLAKRTNRKAKTRPNTLIPGVNSSIDKPPSSLEMAARSNAARHRPYHHLLAVQQSQENALK